MLCAKFGWNWLSGSWELDENVKSSQRDWQTEGRECTIRKARETSVTSIEVNGFKAHNICSTDLPTDRLINIIKNNISCLLSKEIDTKKIIFASVDQIDRPTDRQTDRQTDEHVQTITRKYMTVLRDNFTKFTTLNNPRLWGFKSVLTLKTVLYHSVHTS